MRKFPISNLPKSLLEFKVWKHKIRLMNNEQGCDHAGVRTMGVRGHASLIEKYIILSRQLYDTTIIHINY